MGVADQRDGSNVTFTYALENLTLLGFTSGLTPECAAAVHCNQAVCQSWVEATNPLLLMPLTCAVWVGCCTSTTTHAPKRLHPEPLFLLVCFSDQAWKPVAGLRGIALSVS
jgi:hypothetical protein